MHLTLLLSLAFGLESVVAGPCKPNSITIATTATNTESLGLSPTSSTDTTKATKQSDSTTATTLAISESTFTSTVSSSAPLSDTTALSEQTELTGTTTIVISESASVPDLGPTTSVASSGVSVATSTEVTSTAVSEPSVSTSAELTPSIDASVTTIESAGTTEPTMAADSTTDSTLYSTQISTDTTLEATTTTTTESPTSTTIIDEVSTTTALLPIPTLFTLTAQGGPADGQVIHGNGLPEYSVWIGNGGTRTCTTTDASWSNMYSSAPLYASSGTYYQLRFGAADWAHDSATQVPYSHRGSFLDHVTIACVVYRSMFWWLALRLSVTKFRSLPRFLARSSYAILLFAAS
ncbi:hypothetical protein FPHYL_2489 [Fusarium phyllophilum]|uniref:CBM20 domain-containing protein n=1 Tax=Fusarium phyllophilum TaxID=47803 RepID=A0A8H5K9A4_9HYPO|nr:hypothetical protein FPHYL_2489 [Fusarium phyllophilum]